MVKCVCLERKRVGEWDISERETEAEWKWENVWWKKHAFNACSLHCQCHSSMKLSERRYELANEAKESAEEWNWNWLPNGSHRLCARSCTPLRFFWLWHFVWARNRIAFNRVTVTLQRSASEADSGQYMRSNLVNIAEILSPEWKLQFILSAQQSPFSCDIDIILYINFTSILLEILSHPLSLSFRHILATGNGWNVCLNKQRMHSKQFSHPPDRMFLGNVVFCYSMWMTRFHSEHSINCFIFV